MVSPHLLDPYFSGLSAAGPVAVTKFGFSFALESFQPCTVHADESVVLLCPVLFLSADYLSFVLVTIAAAGTWQSTWSSLSPEVGWGPPRPQGQGPSGRSLT